MHKWPFALIAALITSAHVGTDDVHLGPGGPEPLSDNACALLLWLRDRVDLRDPRQSSTHLPVRLLAFDSGAGQSICPGRRVLNG
jgi:hypothetical protein